MPRGIIYQVTNLSNNKKYIGQTNNLNKRIFDHISSSKRKDDNSYFHKAIRKYGIKKFKWEILCECDDIQLDMMETFKIMVNHTHYTEGGYNLTWGGQGTRGYKFTSKQIENCKKSHIGYKQPKSTREKRKLSMLGKNKRFGKENNRYGIPHSEQTKQKISDKNRKYSDFIINKIVEYRASKVKWKDIVTLLNIPIRTAFRLYRDYKTNSI